MSKHSFFHDKPLAIASQLRGMALVAELVAPHPRRPALSPTRLLQGLMKGKFMTTLDIHSEQPHAGTLHFDIDGGTSLGALILAMAVCALHGDFSAVPALLSLAVMTAIAFGVTQPETGASTGSHGDGAEGATYRHTLLLRRHCLEQ